MTDFFFFFSSVVISLFNFPTGSLVNFVLFIFYRESIPVFKVLHRPTKTVYIFCLRDVRVRMYQIKFIDYIIQIHFLCMLLFLSFVLILIEVY